MGWCYELCIMTSSLRRISGFTPRTIFIKSWGPWFLMVTTNEACWFSMGLCQAYVLKTMGILYIIDARRNEMLRSLCLHLSFSKIECRNKFRLPFLMAIIATQFRNQKIHPWSIIVLVQPIGDKLEFQLEFFGWFFLFKWVNFRFITIFQLFMIVDFKCKMGIKLHFKIRLEQCTRMIKMSIILTSRSNTVHVAMEALQGCNEHLRKYRSS